MPTPEQEESWKKDEARERERLRALAVHARMVLSDAAAALDKSIEAPDVHHARSFIMGPASTFARAVVRLLELA
jgi:hypothetical protein